MPVTLKNTGIVFTSIPSTPVGSIPGISFSSVLPSKPNPFFRALGVDFFSPLSFSAEGSSL
jgi:hypothetical protein